MNRHEELTAAVEHALKCDDVRKRQTMLYPPPPDPVRRAIEAVSAAIERIADLVRAPQDPEAQS